MTNFVRGIRLGRLCFQLSGAPFLFTRFASIGWHNGLALRVRQFEFLIYLWPKSAHAK